MLCKDAHDKAVENLLEEIEVENRKIQGRESVNFDMPELSR